MFLWHILSREEDELIHRVYITQKNSQNTGDWVKLVETDKNELQIDLTDKEIQGVSKEMFRNYVKSKVKIKHLKNLNDLKKIHSKSKYLDCTKLETSEYLKSSRFTTKKKQLLFKLRSKTLDVKLNFAGQHRNLWCISYGLLPESQSHIFQCPELVV